MGEQWRLVTGFAYEVSTGGRVRRLGGAVLKPYPQKGGYLLVTLCRDGMKHRRLVHRLVLAAFRGASSLQGNHTRGQKHDNRLRRLEYVTPAQNRQHAQRLGLHPSTYTLRPSCSHGHALTSVNTRWSRDKNGHRFRACRRCCREAQQRYAAKRKP